MTAAASSDYNSDHNLCRKCDEEPAVYNGLCEICLYDDDDEVGGFYRPTKNIRNRKKSDSFELDE
jgi:hypothetical protein